MSSQRIFIFFPEICQSQKIMSSEMANTDVVNEGAGDEHNSGAEEESVESPDFCPECHNDPCLTEELREFLVSIVEAESAFKSNKQLRFSMYTSATRYIYDGSLGKGVRKKLPDCVVRMIRALSPGESYTGFRAAREREP